MFNKRKQEFYDHFQKLAPGYAKYKRRFSYYWKDIIAYVNYFLTDDVSILDVGCGSGDTLACLKGAKKTGIDFSPEMIKQAKANYPKIKFIEMDAENIQLNEKYDVILLSNTIGYFIDIQDVMQSLKNVCKPTTRIIITYYNQFWEPILRFGEFIGIKKKSPKQNWLSIKDIRNFLELAGFETFRSSKRVLFPAGVPVLSWLFNKIIGKLPFFNNFGLNTFVFARLSASVTYKRDEFSTTVVIPARNESGNIEDAILRMPKFGKHIEIIFVEGNSTDDTWDTHVWPHGFGIPGVMYPIDEQNAAGIAAVDVVLIANPGHVAKFEGTIPLIALIIAPFPCTACCQALLFFHGDHLRLR